MIQKVKNFLLVAFTLTIIIAGYAMPVLIVREIAIQQQEKRRIPSTPIKFEDVKNLRHGV